jgi:hypothetical protein
MAASLLENGGARNTTPPETQSTKENQAESELFKSALFQQARWFFEAFPKRHALLEQTTEPLT